MKRFNRNFKLGEVLLLVFELNMFVAGLVMVGSAMVPELGGLYRPAVSLVGMFPAVMTVGFAAWLVYRMRCLRQARQRGWAVVGAFGLSVVAISFGAAVGNLNMLLMTETVNGAVRTALNDPLTRQASLTSLLAFIGIGVAFGIMFVLRAGRGPWPGEQSIEALQSQLDEIGRRVVTGWSESTVAKIDRLVEDGDTRQAVQLYQQTSACTREEALLVIDDWAAHRLKLELDLIAESIQATETDDENETTGKQSSASVSVASHG